MTRAVYERELTAAELEERMRAYNRQTIAMITEAVTKQCAPRRLSEGHRLDAWKALRAEFEKHMTELLEGSDFAGGDVPYILGGLHDNCPNVEQWEEFIDARNNEGR